MSESYLSASTVNYLLQPIRANRVSKRTESGREMAYVEAHDVKAECIRVFGFGRWSWVVKDTQILDRHETKTSKGADAWEVIAMVTGDLTICAPDGTELATYSGVHCDANVHPSLANAYKNAVTSADSSAFKRAATCALGDAGGLGLYNHGSREALVRGTFVMPGVVGEEPQRELPPTPDVQPESLERQGMPSRDGMETNGHTEPEPTPEPTVAEVAQSRDSEAERTVRKILDALPRREGEKANVWVNRVTKAKVDAGRYDVSAVLVDGVALDVHISNALTEALAALGSAA